MPPDINQNKTIIPPIEAFKSFSIGIYSGLGAGEEGVKNIKENIQNILGVQIMELDAEDIGDSDLSSFDVIIFSGGSGSKQAETIGGKGKENIRTYIKNGGGYLGICAGAYLATSGFDWALHIISAKTISETEWKRGKGFVDLELTKDGKEIFGDVSEMFKCRYSSGPLLQPISTGGLSSYKTLGHFRSEVSENGVMEGVMMHTPAVVSGEYGMGKILLISTHPENTPGLENMIPRALTWLTER